jgi:hypothetical protein
MATVRQGTEGDAGWKNKVVANRRRHSSFPILDWFFGYQKEWLRWDLIAGLITAVVGESLNATVRKKRASIGRVYGEKPGQRRETKAQA